MNLRDLLRSRSRPSLARPPVGTGGLSFDGLPAEAGGAGLVLRDATPRGFSARITGRTSGNAYAFTRADDATPGTFPQLADGTFGTGDATNGVAAFERTGRTDVPTDGTAVVWLDPLGSGIAGYGFTYAVTAAAPGPFTWLSAEEPASPFQHNCGTAGVWETAPAQGISLAAVGEYIVWYSSLASIAGDAGSGGPGYLYARLYNETTAAAVGSGTCAVWAPNSAVEGQNGFELSALVTTLVVSTIIRVQTYVTGGPFVHNPGRTGLGLVVSPVGLSMGRWRSLRTR
jgi:hypothetical protein